MTITDRLCDIAGMNMLPVSTSTARLNTAALEQEQQQQPQHPQSVTQASNHLHQQDLQMPQSAPPSASAVGNQLFATDSDKTPQRHDTSKPMIEE